MESSYSGSLYPNDKDFDFNPAILYYIQGLILISGTKSESKVDFGWIRNN